MDKYTIYCTEEQTRTALKLGAPIKLLYEKDNTSNQQYLILTAQEYTRLCNEGYCYAKVPTTEQMIGWLEEKGFAIDIFNNTGGFIWDVMLTKAHNRLIYSFVEENVKYIPYRNRKEATLAAINAALRYLIENKE